MDDITPSKPNKPVFNDPSQRQGPTAFRPAFGGMQRPMQSQPLAQQQQLAPQQIPVSARPVEPSYRVEPRPLQTPMQLTPRPVPINVNSSTPQMAPAAQPMPARNMPIQSVNPGVVSQNNPMRQAPIQPSSFAPTRPMRQSQPTSQMPVRPMQPMMAQRPMQPAAPQPAVNPVQAQPLAATPVSDQYKKDKKRPFLMAGLVTMSLLVLAGGGWLYSQYHTKKPGSLFNQHFIPKATAASLDFPIYYPNPSKLPKGFNFVENSFANPGKDGLSYALSFGKNEHLAFTLKKAASDEVIDSFVADYVPGPVTYPTPVGDAKLGNFRNQIIVSLPVANGPWIVISAPKDINIDQLHQVLSSMQRSTQ